MNDSARAPSRAVMRIALLVSVLLLVTAAATFFLASRHASQLRGHDPDSVAEVTIQADGCVPAALTVPAGRTVFRIRNQSQRAVEWEILDGVMVMEERENIAPGFTQTLGARLPAGDYAMTCGLLSNPRGTLHVMSTAASDEALAARPTLADYVGVMAEYRVYLAMQARGLRRQADAMEQAIQTGDLARAQRLYAPVRQAYQRIEPVAGLFADLDVRIDGQADYFQARERDPAFKGFHQLELGLFFTRSLTGMQAVMQGLLADIDALQRRLTELTIEPDRMLAGAAALARDMAEIKLSGKEEPHAHTEWWTLQANLDGTVKVATLLDPFLARVDGNLAAKLRKDLERVQGLIATQADEDQAGSGQAGLSEAARQALAQPLRALADDLAQARDALAQG